MIARSHEEAGTRSHALYSACLGYRFALTRVWDEDAARVHFVMLNPSTATELRNDPTVERCERRARRLGFGAFRVTNIFAWRATDPRDLRRAEAPVGEGNDAAILEGADWAACTVCAWGAHGAHLERGRAVERMLRDAGADLRHLGLTKAGHPGHPLYIPYARTPERWTAGAPLSSGGDIA